MSLWWPLAGFFAGSIPFSYLAGRCFGGKDVRREGSGNVGATNVFRVAGRKAGIAAAIGDILKSLLPVLAARLLGAAPQVQVVTAGAVILGHCYSPFLGFRGGKGVISAVSVVAVLFYPAALGFGVVWLASFLLTGYVSLSSILGATALPIAMAVFRAPREFLWFSGAVSLFVTWKHRANIVRLLHGAESKMRGRG